MTMRAALYARYSSDRQNERSIADQFDVLARHAAVRGWTIVARFEDAAISGAAMANRPGLLALLGSAEAGAFDLVLTEDEDRLARNLEHLAHIASRLDFAGVRLATLSTDRVEEMHVAMKGFQASQYLKALGQKTSRGMRSNAEKGLATGSRLYGYRSAPGGATEILAEEAAVVRRIFADYAAGATAREIAAQLNAEGVPGPRGGLWNASTINGSRQRANGVLHTELYAGVKVWNRMEVRKDPRTGKRLPRMRPPAEWRRTAVPHLAIVDDALWRAAAERQAREGARQPHELANARKPGLFSGLIKCGRCGSSYTVRDGGRLVCAANRERGDAACSNRRTVLRAEVETRVLGGLRDRLLAPEAVALYVRRYHEAWARREAEARDARAPLEKRLEVNARAQRRIVTAIEEGVATTAMKARLMELDAEREALATELAAAAETHAPSPMVLHPGLADAWRERIATLQAELAAASGSAAAGDRRVVEALRGLVDRIDVTPESSARGAPVKIALHGRLALFLAPQPSEHSEFRLGSAMVAGGGIEPPTCGL